MYIYNYIYYTHTCFIIPIPSHCFPHQMRQHGFGSVGDRSKTVVSPQASGPPESHILCGVLEDRVCLGVFFAFLQGYQENLEANSYFDLSVLPEDVLFLSTAGQFLISHVHISGSLHLGQGLLAHFVALFFHSPQYTSAVVKHPAPKILRLVMRHGHVYRGGHLDHSNGHRLLWLGQSASMAHPWKIQHGNATIVMIII